jgi:hypothetical protein
LQGIEGEHKKNSILVLRGLPMGGYIVRLDLPTENIILPQNETLNMCRVNFVLRIVAAAIF